MDENKQRPNILFIMADQLTQALIGAYGHPHIQTPNIDKLAQEGICFDNAYTPCPLCGPARAAFATGKYASRLGIYDNASLFKADELTTSHYLTLAGYDCVASGKLHYVGPDQLHGFSRRLTTDIYPEDFSWLQNRDVERSGDAALKGNHAAQYVSDAIRVEWHSNLAYDEEAVFRSEQYLRAKGQQKRLKALKDEAYQPFYLFVSLHHPHDPFKPSQAYWDRYENVPIDLPEYPHNLEETYSLLDRWLNEWHGIDNFDVKNPESLRIVRRAYYALVSYIDDKVGQLLASLAENNLADETVVVFASDHGDMLGEKGMIQKRTFYDWSAKVPLIMRFPDGKAANTRIEQPVSLLDLLPTFLGLAGTKPALSQDGHNLLPLIEEEQTESWDVFAESFAEGVYGSCFMVRTSQYKYVYIYREDEIDSQLFDMHADPDEWHNLAGQKEYEALEENLRQRIFKQFDPIAIEKDIQTSIPRRRLLKQWMKKTHLTWEYTPQFDANRRNLDQYLPAEKHHD